MLREGDLYLLLNASGGLGGRGSHNDALSIEVSACGVSFIADPGTYVYTGDAHPRHEFRSTEYHSTVEVDGAEQNTIPESAPFIIGDEARPHLLSFVTTDENYEAVAETLRLRARLPTGGSRSAAAKSFDRDERFWFVEDFLTGEGEHDFRFVFHAAPGREMASVQGSTVEILDPATGTLFVISVDMREASRSSRAGRRATTGRKAGVGSRDAGHSGARPCRCACGGGWCPSVLAKTRRHV